MGCCGIHSSFCFGPILVLGAMALSDKYRRPIRQFSIRDLLFYVFLWAVCFSQVSVFRNNRPSPI